MILSGLPDAVKLAVSESLDKQRKAQRINSTVAFYGTHDNSQDNQDLLSTLSSLGCKAKVISCIRLVKALNSQSSATVKQLGY